MMVIHVFIKNGGKIPLRSLFFLLRGVTGIFKFTYTYTHQRIAVLLIT